MSQKKVKTSKKHPSKRFIPKYWSVLITILVIFAVVAGVRYFTEPPTSSDQPLSRRSDSRATVNLDELGIAIKISDQLSQQGLFTVKSRHHGNQSYSLSFSTTQLAEKYENCDGIKGDIGSLTRYDGPSDSMAEHHHLSTVFDYPDFHIAYQSVTQSCVAQTPGYSANDLGLEATAARELWEAVKTAQPL